MTDTPPPDVDANQAARDLAIDEELAADLRAIHIAEEMEHLARRLGEQLRVAQATLRGIQIDIGTVAAELKRALDAGTPHPLELKRLADACSVSRVTIDAWAKMASTPEPRRYSDMDSGTLARLALNGYDGAEEELYTRYPGLWTWRRAADVLTTKPHEERTSIHDHQRAEMIPAAKELRARYRSILQQLAAGPLPTDDELFRRRTTGPQD